MSRIGVFLRDNSGQTTVEYILTLLFSVFVFLTFFIGVLKPAISKVWSGVSTQLTTQMNGSNLHQLIIGR